MRRNSLNAFALASILLAAVAATASAQLTYTVVATPASIPTATYTVAAPAAANSAPTQSLAPATTYSIEPVAPALPSYPTTFAPSNEPLAATSYLAAYRANAFEALMQAVNFESQAGRQPLTADELNLFRDAADGRAEHWSMAEAVLVASGVSDRNERQAYMAQIDRITEDAKVATAGAKTPRGKAKQLIKFLLNGPMSAGYVSDQFNMKVLLDTKHFNCVSSAVLFMVVGHRLGMEVAAVQRPGHIFARIPGYDVETTSGNLYPSDIRAERITKTLEKEHEEFGEAYSADRPYHETGDFGALTSMYYDTGCDQDGAKDYSGAVVSYLKAACLDSTNPNLGLHLNNSFKKWFNICLQNHQIGQAAAVANLYRQIARDPAPANQMLAQLAGTQRQVASR
jgi:hypothetical protein